jgi:hypothetical protein
VAPGRHADHEGRRVHPFQTQKTAVYHSSRVQNTIFFPFSQNYDITQVWLQ